MPNRSVRDEMQAVAPQRSYGAPLGPQASVNATDRPKVGPAAPAVQKAALASQGLYRKPVGSSATPAAPRPATPAPAPTSSAPPPQSHALDTYGPLGSAAARIQANPANLNNAIDEQSK